MKIDQIMSAAYNNSGNVFPIAITACGMLRRELLTIISHRRLTLARSRTRDNARRDTRSLARNGIDVDSTHIGGETGRADRGQVWFARTDIRGICKRALVLSRALYTLAPAGSAL